MCGDRRTDAGDCPPSPLATDACAIAEYSVGARMREGLFFVSSTSEDEMRRLERRYDSD
jgi:hypothetical protein